MITVKDFQCFSEIAEELLTLFDEGCKLRDVYPLLRRWQEILNEVPPDERKFQPWIVCNLPVGASQSYYISTTHPTREDDSWRLEWMPYALKDEDEKELRKHLQRMFAAWLRSVKRRGIGPGPIAHQGKAEEGQNHRSNQGVNASGVVVEPEPLPSIEEIERTTPRLDTESTEWVAARKENQEKLGYRTSTLSTYRQEASGGRQLTAYFGVDKDGRRWRRRTDKTEMSTPYYFAPDLKKCRRKVPNR